MIWRSKAPIPARIVLNVVRCPFPMKCVLGRCIYDACRHPAVVKGARDGLMSGDGPGRVRGRPSSLQRDCDRRTASTGQWCLLNVHAKSRWTLKPLRTLRSETKGQAGACPDRTRAIPCKVQTVTAEVS